MASATIRAQRACLKVLAFKNKDLVRRMLYGAARDADLTRTLFAECVLNRFHAHIDRALDRGVSSAAVREAVLRGWVKKMNQVWANRPLRDACLHTSPSWRLIMRRLAKELRLMHAERKAAHALLALA